jgi:AcrR family transcriptional regulator
MESRDKSRRRGGTARLGKTARARGPRPKTPGGRARAVRRRSSDVRRAQIAEATLRIIADKGLREFTARAIAGELGVSDAAIFRHLPSKQAIVGAAIDHVERVVFPETSWEADPVRRLGQFFRQRVATMTGHPGVARLMFSEDLARAGGAQGAARVAGMKRRSIAFVRECLDQADAAHLLAPGLTPQVAALLVVGALMSILQTGRVQSPAGAVRLADEVWRALGRLFIATPESPIPVPESRVPIPRSRQG